MRRGGGGGFSDVITCADSLRGHKIYCSAQRLGCTPPDAASVAGVRWGIRRFLTINFVANLRS